MERLPKQKPEGPLTAELPKAERRSYPVSLCYRVASRAVRRRASCENYWSLHSVDCRCGSLSYQCSSWSHMLCQPHHQDSVHVGICRSGASHPHYYAAHAVAQLAHSKLWINIKLRYTAIHPASYKINTTYICLAKRHSTYLSAKTILHCVTMPGP